MGARRFLAYGRGALLLVLIGAGMLSHALPLEDGPREEALSVSPPLRSSISDGLSPVLTLPTFLAICAALWRSPLQFATVIREAIVPLQNSNAMVCNGLKSYAFTTITGFFYQDQSTRLSASPDDGLLPAFGLLDPSAQRWINFQQAVQELNSNAPPHISYKVIFLGRHGQGFHNVAESKYGTHAWNDYWSKLNADGNITWGPDAFLTPLGISQAEQARDLWLAERGLGLPVPQAIYSSPLSRAATTCSITFNDVISTGQVKAMIKEDLRETLGVHTCDLRRTASYLYDAYPAFLLEPGFTEADELWQADIRETDEELDVRTRRALNAIWAQNNDENANQWISVTAHGGVISSLLRVVQHRPYQLGTGGVIPVLVKAAENVS